MDVKFKVKDLSLADQGLLKIEWAESRMPVLMKLREKYSKEKPLSGIRIGGCLHITKETAVLVRTFMAAGAETAWCGCNPLSTQDDVAAALAKEDVAVFGWRGLSTEEYYWCIDQVIASEPNITLDDGADLVVTIHEKRTEVIDGIIGGTEETTTGVHRLKAMAESGRLKYPIIAVNDAETKWDFDNVYGTGQSSLDGILRATNILLAGKNVVVAGYGHCGRGIALRARGMGANVTVCEVDPIKALKAVMEGYRVMPMSEAAKIGDIFITATGCKDVIRGEHIALMKDGVVLANAGHFNVEISVSDLEEMAKSKKEIRPNNVEYILPDGRRIYLLAEGRLVNLVAAEGHPSEVLDMSFANQFMSVLRLVKEKGRLEPRVYEVPREQDLEIARIKLETMGIRIDGLTPEQERYLKSFEAGT
ncbi:adenosylhomocysteinase [Candidatus Bathyarchaeota archaeon]|nr:adenosylhomocysteinase [Candidatus Bathyarchaeota archaeon]